jgi:Patatin-like phospholipase
VTVFADLVLEGGGVKGIALVSAISVLEERGYQFRRVAGTSAGAIVGSLVAANARAAELQEIMRAVDYVNDTVNMSRAMLNTMTVFYDRMHVEDAAAAARTIVIDTGMVRATDFDLDRDTQKLLFCKGREAALDFLDGAPGQPAWDWAAYRRTYGSSQPPVMRAAVQARDALRSLRHRLHRRDQNGLRTPTGQAGPLKPSATPL